MEHLTGEEVVEYMKIDEDNYTKTDAGLMNKVYDHLSECDICCEAFYKTKRFHSMAELFTGEPIPLCRKRTPLLAALKLGDITAIVDAALHRILDTVDDLSDSIHEVYSQLLSRGFTLAEGFQAELVPSMPGVKGEDQEPDQILIDDTAQSIILTKPGQIILTSGDDAAAALIVSEDGSITEIYEFLPLYDVKTVITKSLEPGSYRVIMLNTV